MPKKLRKKQRDKFGRIRRVWRANYDVTSAEYIVARHRTNNPIDPKTHQGRLLCWYKPGGDLSTWRKCCTHGRPWLIGEHWYIYVKFDEANDFVAVPLAKLSVL